MAWSQPRVHHRPGFRCVKVKSVVRDRSAKLLGLRQDAGNGFVSRIGDELVILHNEIFQI